MKKLSEFQDILLEKKAFAQVALVTKHGLPHVTPLWFDTSKEEMERGIININTATGRVKSNNLSKGSRIAISIMDPNNGYRYLGFHGTILDWIMGPEAESHIDRLAKKYLGKDKYPYRTDKEQRIKLPVRIDSIYR